MTVDGKAEFEMREGSVALTVPTENLEFYHGTDFDKVVIDEESWHEIREQSLDDEVETE